MGVTELAALRTKDWGQRRRSECLSNFRSPAVVGDKVQGVTEGMGAEVE